MTNSFINKLLLVILTSIPFCSLAQMNTDFEVQQRTEEAHKLMKSGHFEMAYNSFRSILGSGKILPTNLSYYFAETLYHIGQYQNSHNFIDKYLKITGKGGDYYQEATELSRLLTQEFNEISSCTFCDISGYRLVTCTNCNGIKNIIESCHICSSSGISSCKKCAGEGVVIVVDLFDEKKYQTCDKCLGNGYHTCETCSGTKTIKLNCPVCIGAGLEKSETTCDHKDQHNH